MKQTLLFRDFFNSEKAGGAVLIFCTFLSILLSNSSASSGYSNLWNLLIGGHHLVEWINEGLMTIFFLLIGLELEREFYHGELSLPKNALLPASAALGGMIVPALIYIYVNRGLPTVSGAGIPMATDIAFALGVLALLGKRVHPSARIFLTALAVIDDLGAILIIAFFYSGHPDFYRLCIAFMIFALLLIMNRFKVKWLALYMVGGGLLWYFMFNSGIHASISGVLFAFALPFREQNNKSLLKVVQQSLHKPVAFIILPLFALANTSIPLGDISFTDIFKPHSLGIIIGLVFGKPLGITAFVYIALLSGICVLPRGIHLKTILGTGMLGGIGFTMSVFITLLAFHDTTTSNEAKLAIVLASVVSGLLGYLFLTLVHNKSLKKYSE